MGVTEKGFSKPCFIKNIFGMKKVFSGGLTMTMVIIIIVIITVIIVIIIIIIIIIRFRSLLLL